MHGSYLECINREKSNKGIYLENKCKFRFHRDQSPPYLAEDMTKLMINALHSESIYPEIITHTNLDLMTKLTEYTSPAKQEALMEAQRSNEELRILQRHPHI